MKFSAETLSYLKGDKFNEDLHVHYIYEPEDYVYRSRFDILTALCQSKTVIHVGCVDHDIDAIERKLKRGTWLHKRLTDVAARCYGIDIQVQGIAYMQERLGYFDSEAINILTHDSTTLLNNHWDYLLLPEVLEHIGNPVEFLSALRIKMKGRVDRVVITVPHALYEGNHKRTSQGVERINSDHRFWFTAYTLSKLMVDAGYEIEKITFSNGGPLQSSSRIHNWYYGKYPMKRNNLMILGRL